jgi:CO/xanthine dehydrogenase Mo-binding subunit
VGQGVHTVFTQIAAEVLGLDPCDIDVVLGNTDETPFALGCHASRVTTLGGNAVIQAAREALVRLKEGAAELLGGATEDIELKTKSFKNPVNGKELPFAQVARHCVLVRNSGIPITTFGVFEPEIEMPDQQTKYGNLSIAYPFGAHLYEVEVDTETGTVEIKNAFAVHDSGKAINPVMIEGQIEGGVAMGIGFALMEEMIYLDGVLKNNNFVDYKIPTMMDIPAIETLLVETYDPNGPFGAKGVGEPPVVPVAPAIANAIFDACGVRIRRLPFIPQRVYSELDAQKSGY